MFKRFIMLMTLTVSVSAMDNFQCPSFLDVININNQINEYNRSLTEQRDNLRENVRDYARQFAQKFPSSSQSAEEVENIYYSTVMNHFKKTVTKDFFDPLAHVEGFLSDLTAQLTLTNNLMAEVELRHNNAFLKYSSAAYYLNHTRTVYNNLVEERKKLIQELPRE